MSTSMLVAPSLLAADWSRLSEEVAAVEAAGADWLHLDVMDGSFVPEISFGARFVESVAKLSTLPLDVHLMVNQPERHCSRFIDAGASRITFQLEAAVHSHRLCQTIREQGAKVGVALNPGTPIEQISPLLPAIDLVLVMSVNPGWGGQKFIPESSQRIAWAREAIARQPQEIVLQVDGGIDAQTIKDVRCAGANCVVAGSFVFGSASYKEAITALK